MERNHKKNYDLEFVLFQDKIRLSIITFKN